MRVIITFLFFIQLTGCVSLKAISDFSSQTVATASMVDNIADDYHDSCLRANVYKPIASASSCALQNDAKSGIREVADLLEAYARAMGNLASDDLVDYGDEFEGLEASINGLDIKGLESDKVTAIGSLIELIANAATDGVRRKELVKYISQANLSVIKVSNGVAEVIEENYILAIQAEIDAWDQNYRLLELNNRDSNMLVWAQYSTDQWRIKVDLESKKASAIALAKALRRIGVTHDKLNQNINDLSGDEVISIVQNYLAMTRPVVQEVRSAFASN